MAQGHPDLRVEGGQRLVEEEHGGLDGERPGERDPLLLAARQLVRVAVARDRGRWIELEQLGDLDLRIGSLGRRAP